MAVETDHLTATTRAETTASSRPLPDMDEIAFARMHFHALLSEQPATIAELGHRVLDRISTANWAMEWCLPIWLSADLRLSANARRKLVLSNVLGLAYVRLMDDLADGDVEKSAEGKITMLASILYGNAVNCYVELVNAEASFWDRFEESMRRWRLGTFVRKVGRAEVVRLPDSEILALADRGAPLKIGCVAACLLSEREDALPPLLAAMDHWLVTAVLLDHAQDWTEDLAAGRFNALVAHAGQRTDTRSPDARILVAEAILLGGAMETYLDIARCHLGRAAEMAGAAGCLALRQQMQAQGGQALAHSERLANRAREQLHSATSWLLRLSPMPDRQPNGREGGRQDGS